MQYADYALWQRRWLTGERPAQQLDYWRAQLRGAPPLVELPLDAGLTARLRHLARESETTLFVTLLAAYAALLSRLGDAGDVVIGTAVANRYPAETEALIGFFVNTLPLRLRWQDGATFRELQACAHRAAVGGYTHPDVPFDQIVDALQLERSALFSPLFQTSFVLQNVPKQELTLPGLAATCIARWNSTQSCSTSPRSSASRQISELCWRTSFRTRTHPWRDDIPKVISGQVRGHPSRAPV